MSTHFSMGAINKDTSNYEYPKIASKKNKYKCPSCDKDVIFRNGKIKAPHYAHKKSESQCFYYDKPTETQIHKDAKMLLKSLLDNKQCIYISKMCKYCKYETIEDWCEGGGEMGEYIDSYYNENTKAVIEYRFHYNNSKRSADVALIEQDKIKYIFEICYKNKTKEENRPEPWIEIKAADLLNNVNSRNADDDCISIDCIRDYKCDYCIENDKKEYLIKKQKELERERQERERQERERQEREYLIKKQKELERERQREIEYQEILETVRQFEREEKEHQREIEEKELQQCKRICGISHPCVCEIPKYILVSINNNYYCNYCRKWKCRC